MTIERDEFNFDAPAPLGHPGRRGLPEGHDPGPAVGETLPSFALPDAYGNEVSFEPGPGGKKTVVVFYRSAVW